MYLNRKEQQITIAGERYTAEEIRRLSAAVTADTATEWGELYTFLNTWFDESPLMQVQTSGSTGAPKVLTVRKEQMMQSARITCEALRLNESDTALLALPLQYIAGQMMVVRALVAGLNLLVRKPSGHPLADVDQPIRLAAFVPLQLYQTLETPEELQRLRTVGTLLIGGGVIDPRFRLRLRSLPGELYATYGMTETLSHIALCRLNGDEADGVTYYPLPGVKLTLSAHDTLQIEAPLVCDEVLITNDLVSFLPDGGFQFRGRRDNVINSGGIKLQPEVLEELLQPHLTLPFVFTSAPHERLGEVVVLLVEGVFEPEEIRQLIRAHLPSNYPCDKYIFPTEQLPLTENGKIDRLACKRLTTSLFPAHLATE